MGAAPLSEYADCDTARLHASCVAVQGHGLLITGPSGAGKSGLALQLMALGAQFVADDQVALSTQKGQLIANAVPAISGLIEARGIGLLRAQSVGAVHVSYIVDLQDAADSRLPEPTEILLLRQTVPLLRARGIPNLAAALMQLAKMGRVDPEWPST